MALLSTGLWIEPIFSNMFVFSEVASIQLLCKLTSMYLVISIVPDMLLVLSECLLNNCMEKLMKLVE